MVRIKRHYLSDRPVTAKVSTVKPVSYTAPKRSAAAQELRELCFQSLVRLGHGHPQATAIFSDIKEGKINLEVIASDPARKSKAELALKYAWARAPRYEIELPGGSIMVAEAATGIDQVEAILRG